VKRFQSQYKKRVEVRLHQKEIHDRAIVVDEKEFYTFGASIKDLGKQLSVLNKLEDQTNVASYEGNFRPSGHRHSRSPESRVRKPDLFWRRERDSISG
jgi:hypothetical protein